MIDCYLTSRSRASHSCKNIIAGEELQNVGLRSALTVFEHGGFFIVHIITYDMESRFTRSLMKDRFGRLLRQPADTEDIS